MNINQSGEAPLPSTEICKLSRHVWNGYKVTNRIWVGGEARAVIPRSETDLLLPLKNGGDALTLLTVLRQEHGTRERFVVVARAMSLHGRLSSWSEERIEKAKDALLASSLIW